MWLSAPRHGEFWWSDSPRHALNGVFVMDPLPRDRSESSKRGRCNITFNILH
jgi:hypothetical protein